MVFVLGPDPRLAKEIVKQSLSAPKRADPHKRDRVVTLVDRALQVVADYESFRRNSPKDVQKTREVLKALERAALRAAKLVPTPELCLQAAEYARVQRQVFTKPVRRRARPTVDVEMELRTYLSRDDVRALMSEVRRALKVTAHVVDPDEVLRVYLNTPPE